MRWRTAAEIGAAVAEQRRVLGLSQADLAARARVSREWLSAFERGKGTVHLRLVLDVLYAVGLEVTLGERQ